MLRLLQNIPLGYYALSGFINFITAFSISLIVFLSKKKSKANKIFATFSLSVAYWSLLYFIWLITKSKEWAEFYLRSCMIGVLFMSSLFIHFIASFLNLKINKKFILANYILSTLFMFTVYTPLYARDIGRHLVFPYWLHPGPIFHVALIHFGVIVLYSFYLMWQSIKKEKGIFRNQILYIFIGTATGYISGVTNFFCWYRINIPPFLNIFVSVYVIMVTIAVIKYHLLDITIVLTRAGIFIGVYVLVLGIPFWLGHTTKTWFSATALAVILASLGPFIYNRLRLQVEAKIQAEERRAREMLTRASEGMTRIRNLKKLVGLIIHLCSQQMKLRNCSIWVLDKETGKYTRRDARRPSLLSKPEDLDKTHPLIQYLENKKSSLVYEEIKFSLSDKDPILIKMRELSASVIVPAFIGELLLGFLTLDEKRTKKSFSKEDLDVLEVLSNQAALAIENAQLFSEKTLALEKIERMFFGIIKSLGLVAQKWDPVFTKTHIERTSILASAVCQCLVEKGVIKKEEKDLIIYGNALHDIGKYLIPEEILYKAGKLTEEEWEIIKKHVKDGADLLYPIEGFGKIREMVLYSHELYNGKGYCGLKGEEIPFGSRVIILIDAFDAIINPRPYRLNPFTLDEAIAELERNKGTQFDPILVDIFVEIIKTDKKVKEIIQEIIDEAPEIRNMLIKKIEELGKKAK